MVAITLWRPWSWALFHGKTIENRTWAPPAWIVGKQIVIHAGKTYDKEGDLFCCKVLGLGALPSEARPRGAHD